MGNSLWTAIKKENKRMCHQIKTIAKNCNGQLSFCKGCNCFHLDFNNITLKLRKKDLKAFKQFLESIEVEYWEAKYERQVMKRKIPIPTAQENLVLMFNKQELESLKDLVFLRTTKYTDPLSVLDIDYTLFLN
jgi:hypothetical protein